MNVYKEKLRLWEEELTHLLFVLAITDNPDSSECRATVDKWVEQPRMLVRDKYNYPTLQRWPRIPALGLHRDNDPVAWFHFAPDNLLRVVLFLPDTGQQH